MTLKILFNLWKRYCHQLLITSYEIFNVFISTPIGGLVGLFSGMSILSVFEVLFWIIRLVVTGMEKMATAREEGQPKAQSEAGDESITEEQDEEGHGVDEDDEIVLEELEEGRESD